MTRRTLFAAAQCVGGQHRVRVQPRGEDGCAVRVVARPQPPLDCADVTGKGTVRNDGMRQQPLLGWKHALAPPRHLSAAAAMTPSGVPPTPIITSTPEPGTTQQHVNGGTHECKGGVAPSFAVAIAAATSPSEMRRTRAPAARMSAMSFACRGRSRTTVCESERASAEKRTRKRCSDFQRCALTVRSPTSLRSAPETANRLVATDARMSITWAAAGPARQKVGKWIS